MINKIRQRAYELSRERSEINEIVKAYVAKHGTSGDVAWSAITGKPTTFSPTAHGSDKHTTEYAPASHASATDNPHSVTKTQVGLANVTDVAQMPLSYLDTDDTLAADSDSKVPSQQAVKAYVAAHAGGEGGGGVLYGTWATRPAAGTSGRLHVPTDGFPPAIDDGAAWNVNIDGFKCTNPPAVATLTAVEFSTHTTAVDSGDGILFKMMGTGSSTHVRSALLASVLEAPYIFEVAFDLLLYPVTYSYFGIALTNGTDTNAEVIDFEVVWNTNGNSIEIVRMNNWTTWFSAPLANRYISLPSRLYMKVYDDNTNLHYYISVNGKDWHKLLVEARTAHITATHIGLSAHQATTGVATTYERAVAMIHHWKLAAA